MSTTELLPCPFCGGEAVLQKHNVSIPGRIVCQCGAEIRAYRGQRIEELVAAWNSRSVTAAAVMGYEAAQAERTCTNASYRLDESRFHCSECGFGCWVKDVADGRDKLPTYCPRCGAKVVER